MTFNETLEYGRRYIARGWPVFILSASKTPIANCDACRDQHVRPEQMEACRCLTCHAFYAATLDPDRLAEMVAAHPNGLLAVRTGTSSGTAVVDVDPAGLPEMGRLVIHGKLPRTLAARTGRGFHLVYGHPGGKISSGAGKIAPGIDSKSDGAYIVVAPSVHPVTRTPYRWLAEPDSELSPLPGHLVERLREPVAQRNVSVPIPARGQRAGYGEAAVRGELEKLLALERTEGTRNDELNRSAFALGQLVAGGMLDHERTADLLSRAGLRIGLGSSEVRLTVASGLRAGALYPRGGAV